MAPIIEVDDDDLKAFNQLGIKYKLREDLKNNHIKNDSSNLSFITDENLYKEIIKYLDKTFPDKKSDLSAKLEFENNVMKGSNTYTAAGIDMYLKSINSKYRLARQLDLEQDLPFTKSTYNDSGLALRNLIRANKKQGIYLFNQLKSKGIKKSDFPIWLDLRGLTLDNHLNFNLTDESKYKTAECLNWYNGTKFSKINDFGLPKEKDENSSRQIWTKNYALSSCYLNRYSGLDSGSSDLSISDDAGRVVLAKSL